MLNPFMLRRLKTDVEIAIPPKTEIKIYVPLTELQTQCYKSIISHNLEFIQKFNNINVPANSKGNTTPFFFSHSFPSLSLISFL